MHRAALANAILLLLTACTASDPAPAPAPAPELAGPPPFEAPACAATAVTTACDDAPSVVPCIGIAGYDFLQAYVGYNSEDSAIVLSAPDPGTVCAGGTLGATEAYIVGVSLGFNLSPRDDAQTCVLDAFDARALDIAAIQFDLSDVPAARVTFWAAVITQTECHDDDAACTEGGYYSWLTADRQELVELQSGTNRVPFDDLVGDDLDEPLGARWISDFGVGLEYSLVDLPFEYCISNIQLLDSAGHVVLPVPTQ